MGGQDRACSTDRYDEYRLPVSPDASRCLAYILPGSMNHDVAPSLNRTAFQATVHCLTGCAIGEVLGLVIATALGWHDLPSVLLAIVLAFVFGYGLTIRPVVS